MIATAIQLGPVCRDKQRRADLLDQQVLNGIDYVEYERRENPPDSEPPFKYILIVKFLNQLPDHVYGLVTDSSLVRIEGGTRIVGIRVLGCKKIDEKTLEIDVDQAGDFSIYWLSLGWAYYEDIGWVQEIDKLDPYFSRAPVNFKAGCPTEFDCQEEPVCPPENRPEPNIDYMAKDYASFRQLLLDSIPQLNPDWLERNPADLGITLVELLAYTGDYLSYFQDAVANEMYLDTARQRVSAKRHAKLVDYQMHDGRNAWTFVHVSAAREVSIPAETQFLTRISTPLRGTVEPPKEMIPEDYIQPEAFEFDPALKRVEVFESRLPAKVQPEHNTLFIHTWGNTNCCLPRGTTEVYLYAAKEVTAGPEADPKHVAIRPEFQAGDYLLFEEVKGVKTGAKADANPLHRQVVRLTEVMSVGKPVKPTDDMIDQPHPNEPLSDKLYSCNIENGVPTLWTDGDDPLPLLRVRWHRDDGLDFPLCLSTITDSDERVTNVSVARGNMVLADHGRTIEEVTEMPEGLAGGKRFLLELSKAPLTMRIPSVAATARSALDGGAVSTGPAISIEIEDVDAGSETWYPVPDLLDSPPLERHFVVDLDHRGRASLRFGDGQYGRAPVGATKFTSTYRLGNGRSGNLGAESLVHVVYGVAPTDPTDTPDIVAIRNPLPARGGEDAETIEQVRQYAPAAFHAEQFRAVTEADYVAAAMKMPDVAGAVADFRWTGSWFTVMVGIDPLNPEDLITLSGGRTQLEQDFASRVTAFLTRYKLAGYELAVRAAKYVPLEIELTVCALPGYFKGDVLLAVRNALSSRSNADGSKGFFHPDFFSFGQPVYLSRIYAATEAVTGVSSVVVDTFRRFGSRDRSALKTGTLTLGSWEIARLDNDPNFAENGVLKISMGGGK